MEAAVGPTPTEARPCIPSFSHSTAESVPDERNSDGSRARHERKDPGGTAVLYQADPLICVELK